MMTRLPPRRARTAPWWIPRGSRSNPANERAFTRPDFRQETQMSSYRAFFHYTQNYTWDDLQIPLAFTRKHSHDPGLLDTTQ